MWLNQCRREGFHELRPNLGCAIRINHNKRSAFTYLTTDKALWNSRLQDQSKVKNLRTPP